MKLSKRLQASADFVEAGSCVADVGCDHAYTSIYLAQSGIAKKCIAMDIREGPLLKARENIEKYRCGDKIETRLSDGLKELVPGEVDTVLISGMGGLLIRQILMDSPEVFLSLKSLVVQPQSEIEGLRHTLLEKGCAIQDETMVYEDGKYYVSIHAIPGRKTQPYSQRIEYMFGKPLLDRKDKVLAHYLEERLIRYQDILSGMKRHGKSEQDADVQEIKGILEQIVFAKLWFTAV